MEPHGTVLGIPYDFRVPSWRKLKSHYWNPEDERVFLPRAFGIGWDINLYQLRARYPRMFKALVVLTVAGTLLDWAVRYRRRRKKRRQKKR